jgi:DDE superfamily endonuclease
MRDLADVHFPRAERIRVVLDNLSTHSVGALYQAFPPSEARRLLRRLEFHFVPKHASWLNMVEIEIGVLRSQCLDRRIDSQERLVSEIAAWERQRNSSRARIKWMFTTEKARAKSSQPKSHNHCDEVLDGSIEDFDAALALDPTLAVSLYGRGVAKRKNGDPAGADADLAAAQTIRPGIEHELASEIE